MNPFSRDQLAAFRTLRNAYPDARIVLIGASALGMHLNMTWRNTADVDLVLTISMSELDAKLSQLEGWRHDPKRAQRWIAPNDVILDLVPASPEAIAAGSLTWHGGRVMDLSGVGLALRVDHQEELEDLGIGVAPIPVIVLMKMVAYVDAHDREKDLHDIAYILDEYPKTDDERFFSDEIFELGLNEATARAFILGREMRDVVGDDGDTSIVERFLERVRDGWRWSRFVTVSPWRYDEEQLRTRLDALNDGFSNTPGDGLEHCRR